MPPWSYCVFQSAETVVIMLLKSPDLMLVYVYGALKSSWSGDGRQMSVFGGATMLKWDETDVGVDLPFEST